MSGNLDEIDRIYWEASQLDSSDERNVYLDSACGDDSRLRLRVEKLLNAQSKAERFLERPFDSHLALELVASPLTECLGTHIGPYTLQEEIGEGGMGVVYLAEQREPVPRKVALKIIKPGMDSRAVVARFEVERQALALLDHPNVARVLDAGATASGRPYFVMEFVDGVPITEFCDRHAFSTPERLEIFVLVCQAVQHLHQKGIIHRDLKPSNILVALTDGVPVPKIIDFGIAKAVSQPLTDQSVFTRVGQMVGTPLYMSPEQAELNRVDIDTRSDVYSLGAVLYELLTGATPMDGERLRSAGVDEVRRVIREDEPLKPSSRVSTLGQAATTVSMHRKSDPTRLCQLLHGELDWIVMKALEKDRNRRYETASALAADVRRHLHDEPVEACPPTFGYRLRKLVRKHRVGVVTMLLVAMALAAGTGIAPWQATRARHAQRIAEGERSRAVIAEQRAVTEASIATAINDFLQHDLLQQVDSGLQRDAGFAPQPNLTVKEALDRASSAIDTRFRDRPLVEAGIRMAIAGAYASIADQESALPHLERAVALRQSHLGLDHPETLNSLTDLALAYEWVGRLPDAVRLLTQLVQSRKETLGEDHETTLNTMMTLADAYWKSGQWENATQLYKRTYARYATMLGPDHPNTLASLDGLAVTYRDSGLVAEAIVMLEQLVEESQRRLGTDHQRTVFLMHRLAIAYHKAKRLTDAEVWLRKALACGRQDDTSALQRTAGLQTHLGMVLLLQHRYPEAESALRQALAIFEAESPDIWRRFHAMNLLGGALLGQQQYADAESLLLVGYQGMWDREAMIFAADKLRLTEALDRLIQFYETTGDFEQAYFWSTVMGGGSNAVDPSGQ